MNHAVGAHHRPIVFLSDYGLADEFVGICHAVMARISPRSQVIDLSHAIPPQDVLRGAIVLARAIRFLPPEAVILGVVDPGVGTPRRPIAVETNLGGRQMVGPDNGLLSLAWGEDEGLAAAREITSSQVRLEPVSATFHGRDVFAPTAAHLAAGMPLSEVGSPFDPTALVTVDWPSRNIEPGLVETEVIGVDRLENVQLSAQAEDLERAGLANTEMLEVARLGERSTIVPRVSTFGELAEGQTALIVDSSGALTLVVNRGSGAEVMGLAPGDPVSLRAWQVP